MLIKFFRSSYLVQYFFLVLVAAALWVPGFISHPGLPVEPGLITPLYNLAHYLLSLFDAASPAVALAIILLSSITLNNVLVYHELTPKNNLLPAFIFIVLMGSNPLILCSYPVLIAFPVFTWFLHTAFLINDEPENYMEVFNASILVSIISLIYTPAIFLSGYILLILLIYGTFNGRNLLVALIAFAIPYIYLCFYYFWTDQLTIALGSYQEYFRNIFTFQVNKGVLQIVIWVIFAVFMIMPAFMRITSTLSSFNINFRKKMAATAWFAVFAVPFILLDGRIDYHTLIYLPATVMIAHFYNLFKKSIINELTLLLFLLLVLLNNYLHLFHAQIIFH